MCPVTFFKSTPSVLMRFHSQNPRGFWDTCSLKLIGRAEHGRLSQEVGNSAVVHIALHQLKLATTTSETELLWRRQRDRYCGGVRETGTVEASERQVLWRHQS